MENEMEFETEKNVNAPKGYLGWERGSIDVERHN
jgi:hypothetical protein